jgi:hypothetical protein
MKKALFLFMVLFVGVQICAPAQNRIDGILYLIRNYFCIIFSPFFSIYSRTF